jgi:hypothetical protein
LGYRKCTTAFSYVLLFDVDGPDDVCCDRQPASIFKDFDYIEKHHDKSILNMKTKQFDAADAGMINLVTAVDDHSMYTCIRCVAMCPY